MQSVICPTRCAATTHSGFVAKMWRLDPKIFHFVSLFICVRCFNPFDDGQYDIDWGGPVTLREGQVTPVSLGILNAQLFSSV